MERIKVLVLSSVTPNEQGSGGELALQRYVNCNPAIESCVFSWRRFPFRLKLIGKLKQFGLRSVSRSWECLFPVLPPRKMISKMIDSFRPHLLLTVAHGWWHIQARRVAKEFKLPLVSFFQDWWPDFPDVPLPLQPFVERQFRRTCAESAVAICVSDGMLRELGKPRNALVIYPLPSLKRSRIYSPNFKMPLRVVYFGNLSEYGPMIEAALRAMNGSQEVRLEVFGPRPLWTAGAEDYFRARGLYHGFPSSDQITNSLQEAQAVLVVMSFDADLRRRMATSFPSKLIDATQFGLPLVLWGPEHCSAIQWARRGGRALCVTDPSPSILRQVLEQLAASPSEQQRLAKEACDTAVDDFNPEHVQEQFVGALRRAICARSSHP